MTDERWQRVKALFQAAIDLPESERDALLTSAAEGDDELRREVESLLASDTADLGVLDRIEHVRKAVLADLPAAAEASPSDSHAASIVAP